MSLARISPLDAHNQTIDVQLVGYQKQRSDDLVFLLLRMRNILLSG